MAYEACPFANEACKYWGLPPRPALKHTQSEGCYSDRDHIIPQRIGRLALVTQRERDYINSESNIRQTCRFEHDNKSLGENDTELREQLRILARQAQE